MKESLKDIFFQVVSKNTQKNKIYIISTSSEQLAPMRLGAEGFHSNHPRNSTQLERQLVFPPKSQEVKLSLNGKFHFSV